MSRLDVGLSKQTFLNCTMITELNIKLPADNNLQNVALLDAVQNSMATSAVRGCLARLIVEFDGSSLLP